MQWLVKGLVFDQEGHGSAWYPVIEDVSDLGDVREMFMVDGCWRVFDCTGEKFYSMGYSIIYG